jgi:hypothetical protein
MFSLVSNRYERASLIVTSNKPFSAWGEIFGNDVVAAAVIDRLVHHAEIASLRGDSHRLKDKDLGGTTPTQATEPARLRPAPEPLRSALRAPLHSPNALDGSIFKRNKRVRFRADLTRPRVRLRPKGRRFRSSRPDHSETAKERESARTRSTAGRESGSQACGGQPLSRMRRKPRPRTLPPPPITWSGRPAPSGSGAGDRPEGPRPVCCYWRAATRNSWRCGEPLRGCMRIKRKPHLQQTGGSVSMRPLTVGRRMGAMLAVPGLP